MFFVSPFGAYTMRLLGLPTREQATYSWPCEKHRVDRSSPATPKDCPCDLFIVIAYASLTGNCVLLNWKIRSVLIRGIRGIRTFCPLCSPARMVAAMTLLRKYLTTNLVPLHNLGGSRFRNNIIGEPTFIRACGVESQRVIRS